MTKKKWALGCGILVLIAAAIGIGVCLSVGNELTKEFQVRYEVTGTAETVDITYQNADGGTSQLSDVTLPWSLGFTGQALDFVYVSAQNQGDTGTVTATIYRDNEQLATSTSSGAYVIASADGSL
jgi:hypothetical protein